MTSNPHFRFSTRLFSRRRAIVYTLVWLLLGLYFGRDAYDFSHRLTGTFTGIPDSPATRVQEALVKNFSTALAFPTALVWDGKGLPEDVRQAAWQRILEAGKDAPGVMTITEARGLMREWPRDDWYAAFIEMDVKSFGQAETKLPQMREYMRSHIELPPGAGPYYITGGPAMFLDLNLASTKALRTAELYALPLAFIILVIVFRTAVAALLPVIVAGVGVIVTLGLLSILAQYYPVTFFVPNLVTMLGLGVGIDYSLIFLARYRRERTMHLTTQEALQVARKTAGHTVIASATLVMSGFIALLAIPLEFFHSIALGGMLVVGSVALSTFTLLPALIVLLGKALEWGQLYSTTGGLSQRARTFNHWWSKLLLAHPWKFFVLGALILLGIAYPATRLSVTSLEVDTLPPEAEARLGFESLERELGAGWLLPTVILVQHRSEDWLTNGTELARERELLASLRSLPNTSDVISIAEPSMTREERMRRIATLEGMEDPTQTLILVISRNDPQSTGARAWLNEIDRLLAAQMQKHPGGPAYTLGGVAATTKTTDGVIFRALPQIILITLCTTFILLFLFMKSIFVPLKAIVLNLLCVLAAYGFQVLWFQDGWGAGIGAFEKMDGLNTVVLVILFCALFGLSMDYEVFILSAVRESWLDQKDMRIAVEEGLQRTAGIITSAAIILVCVFLCFAFGSVVETQQLGVGLSFAVILDATLIRLVLVPSSMALMGEWNWWLPGQPIPVRGKRRKALRRMKAFQRLRRLNKQRRRSHAHAHRMRKSGK